MAEHTTRIDQLPDNITMQINGGQNIGGDTNYAPMNVHPNPYGNALQPHNSPMPEMTSVKNDPPNQPQQGILKLNDSDKEMLQNTPRVRLPSRDLPIDEDEYLHDEEITANYIPKVRFKDDYVKDYEEVTTEKILQRERKKKNDSWVDALLNDLQVPLLITMLFFLFQMPAVNTIFFKRFAFLSIYNSDGNINFFGIALKSIIFGGIFYCLQKTVNVLVDM
jgi:hypothetical protein